jgi:hypothetical protein
MRQRKILYCDQTISHNHKVFEFTYITIATGRTRQRQQARAYSVTRKLVQVLQIEKLKRGER